MSKFDLVKLMWYHNKVRWKVRRLSGAPPLSFKGRGKNLKNYRIYGQNSRNLFDVNILAEGYDIGQEDGLPTQDTSFSNKRFATSAPIFVSTGIYYLTFDKNIADNINFIVSVFDGDNFISRTAGYTSGGYPIIITSGNKMYICFYNSTDVQTAIHLTDISNIMFNAGSTALPYEPYGESVGDRTANLFDKSKATRDVGHTYDGIGNYVTSDASNTITGFIAVDENTTYTIKNTNYPPYRVHYFDINKQWISRTNSFHDKPISLGMAVEFTTPNNTKYIIMQELNTNRMHISSIMLNAGSTALPYEPYGYRVPATVTNGTDTLTTNLYLPEPIKMVGEEAEYIDYAEQKQYFADGTSTDVLLPALPTISGTNTLSVGTEVQPSEVYVEGKIRFIHEGSGENEGE